MDYFLSSRTERKMGQDSIPGCVPPAQWQPLDASTGVGGVGPQVNKFEQVSSDEHQISAQRGGPWSGVGRRGGGRGMSRGRTGYSTMSPIP